MKLPKIEKRGDAYRAQIQIDGKRYSVTAATPKEVEREVAALKLKLKKAPAKASELTLTKAIDAYIEARKNVLSPSTIRGYRTIQDNRLQTLMPKPVKSLTPEVCQKAVNAEAKLCSSKTLHNAWGFIGSVIADATGGRPNVTVGQVVSEEQQFLDKDQIKVFIEAVKGDKVEIPALLALSSLRTSEIMALSWDKIDLKNRLITVSGAAVPGEDHRRVIKKENKNKTSRRLVPIIDPLFDALNAVEDKRGMITTISYSAMRNHVHNVCKANGLPVVGLHGLRHSFASLAYSLGMPEKVTMEIGGWSNDQTMRKIYTHIAQRDKDHYTSAFTSFFENAPKNAPENENCQGSSAL